MAKKIKLASKAVVKIQPGTKIGRKKKTEMKVMSDSDKYFIDQMVELEKTRMDQQMKIERERLQAEIAAREANIKFQWRCCRCKCNSIHFMHNNHHHSNTFMIFDCIWVIFKLSGTTDQV